MSSYEKAIQDVAPVITPRQIKVFHRRFNAGKLNNGNQTINSKPNFEKDY